MLDLLDWMEAKHWPQEVILTGAQYVNLLHLLGSNYVEHQSGRIFFCGTAFSRSDVGRPQEIREPQDFPG